ncbi:PhzF family phenazine biosynthesis isomerase [Rickettsiella endosymbiont of Miltochrista miniata]|uniref:PhzF family phenazine biosynthesis protein n=1 Tax=Rickettsiella endosymbiont of Miltochrista miniata TaxID=3066239 RepID=UPI00313B8A4D
MKGFSRAKCSACIWRCKCWGNPCAIVDNAAHLSKDEMQAMATHFNLPETVFIIPDKNQYLLRFFATKGELPLCCHGALGAAYYLFKSDYGKSFNIKPYQTKTDLDIACNDNLISMSMVNNGKIIDDNIDLDIISKLLAIDKTSINAHLPCAVASIGSPKLLAPVIDRNILFNMEPNLDLISQWCKKYSVNGVYVYSNDTEQPHSDYVGRNFNPLFSNQEDIATGVAAAALAFMLNLKNDKEKNNFTIEQGANLTSPSRIDVSIDPEKISIKGEAYFNQ